MPNEHGGHPQLPASKQKDQEMFYMYDEAGWSLQSIADLYDVSLGQVSKRVKRAGGIVRPRGRPRKITVEVRPENA